MRTMTALAAILVLALLIACGPAAQTGQSSKGGNDIPIVGGSPQQSSGPVEPTATPVPQTPEPPPAIDPSVTPKPPPPTRAPHADDKEPEPTPTPERDEPVPTPISPVLESPAEPEDGISVCYGINPYNTTIDEQGYLDWCHGALVE